MDAQGGTVARPRGRHSVMDGLLDELIGRYPALAGCRRDVEAAFGALERCFDSGGKLLVCGNGGSAADSDHIVGELQKGFLKKRRLSGELAERLAATDASLGPRLARFLQEGLPAVNLAAGAALQTACANDQSPELVFAQAVLSLGKPGDALLAISTSGNAANVNAALVVARSLGLVTIGLTGATGGDMRNRCDVVIRAPGTRTFEVQEHHLPIYHCLCAMIEQRFFKE